MWIKVPFSNHEFLGSPNELGSKTGLAFCLKALKWYLSCFLTRLRFERKQLMVLASHQRLYFCSVNRCTCIIRHPTHQARKIVTRMRFKRLVKSDSNQHPHENGMIATKNQRKVKTKIHDLKNRKIKINYISSYIISSVHFCFNFHLHLTCFLRVRFSMRN